VPQPREGDSGGDRSHQAEEAKAVVSPLSDDFYTDVYEDVDFQAVTVVEVSLLIPKFVSKSVGVSLYLESMRCAHEASRFRLSHTYQTKCACHASHNLRKCDPVTIHNHNHNIELDNVS